MDKRARYQDIQASFESILEAELPWESALVSMIALLKEKLDYVSWAGFYRLKGEVLWIGPYQGPLACLRIALGEGVCGVSARDKEVQLVPDVHAFPGHIACDALSQSEIVLPVFRADRLVGVLDLDSHQKAAFDEVDQRGLESLLAKLPR